MTSNTGDIETELGLAEASSLLHGETEGQRTVVRWHGTTRVERLDTLASEEPLEIRLAGRSLTVTMRTPGYDEELAAGLLYAQELLSAAADLGVITRDPAQPNILDVRLSSAVDGAERWRRYTFASSSCGICGVESLDALVLNLPPVTAPLRIRAGTLYRLEERLRAAQTASAPVAARTPRRSSRPMASYWSHARTWGAITPSIKSWVMPC